VEDIIVFPAFTPFYHCFCIKKYGSKWYRETAIEKDQR